MALPLIFQQQWQWRTKYILGWFSQNIQRCDWFVSITNISFSVINFRGKFLSRWNSYHAFSYRKMPTSLAHICFFVLFLMYFAPICVSCTSLIPCSLSDLHVSCWWPYVYLAPGNPQQQWWRRLAYAYQNCPVVMQHILQKLRHIVP